MSDSLEGLRRQLGAAGDLKSVVRAMKALAASSLGQYEKAVVSLRDYSRTIELGLNVCLRQSPNAFAGNPLARKPGVGLVVFGSDQGLVGQFNETIADFLQTQVPPSSEIKVWAIGERVSSRMEELGFTDIENFVLPNSIQAIASLIGQVLVSIEAYRETKGSLELHVFHHRPAAGAAYEPIGLRLLPLDKKWAQSIREIKWPTSQIPQSVGDVLFAYEALLREYIFVSLFQACAESLASENASRLAGMQRAEKNIDELSEELTRRFHRLRQSSIDEELFDVVTGFEALSPQKKR